MLKVYTLHPILGYLGSIHGYLYGTSVQIPLPECIPSVVSSNPSPSRVHDLDCCEPVEHKDSPRCCPVPPGILNPFV